MILEPKKIKSLTVAHFFLVLNGVPRSGCEQSPVVSRCDMVSCSLDVSGVPRSGCDTVSLSTYPLKAVSLAASLGSYE